MSWKASAWAKNVTSCPDGSQVTRSEKLLLLVMADDYRDHDGMCISSMRQLASDALMSVRTVRRLVRSLELKGLVETHFGGPRNWQPNGYRFPALSTAARGTQSTDTMSPQVRTPCPQLESQSTDMATGVEKPKYGHFEHKVRTFRALSTDIAMSASLSDTITHDEEEEADSSSSPSVNSKPNWEPEELWLQELLIEHRPMQIPLTALDDADWWRQVAKACGGLDRELLPQQLAAMGAKILEEGGQPRTDKEWRRFVRHWLINDDRRETKSRN